MGLSKFDVKKNAGNPVIMTLRSPVDGEPIINDSTGKPMTLSLISPDSDEYKRRERQVRNARLREQSKSGRPVPKIEDVDNDQLELTLLCIKGWEGVEIDEGQPLPCDEESKRKVLTHFPWVREQVEAFIRDRANFLGN